MLRLASFLFAIVGTTLAGSCMIAVLAAGYDTTVPILIATAVGALAGVPVSLLIARAIVNHGKRRAA